jgi:methionyl-tRNA synthetase
MIKEENGKLIHMTKDLGKALEWTIEDNYLFKLSEKRESLRQWLKESVIYPNTTLEEIRKAVNEQFEEQLADISVSRLSSRLKWGIPVPNDPAHTIYVWLDALVNYLTVLGYPNHLPDHFEFHHFIGKDILKFHSLYWPAFLDSAGFPMPKKIISHGHWIMNGRKMSKSLGNVIDPFELLQQYEPDPIRYYLIRDGRLDHDCEFSHDSLNARLSFLSDKLGNLLLRMTSAKINPKQILPNQPLIRTEHDQGLERLLIHLPGINIIPYR